MLLGDIKLGIMVCRDFLKGSKKREPFYLKPRRGFNEAEDRTGRTLNVVNNNRMEINIYYGNLVKLANV